MTRSGLLILAAGLLVAAERPDGGDADREMKKLQGRWVATALEQNGDQVPPDQVN